MKNTKYFFEYLELEKKLFKLRSKNNNQESQEEDDLLSDMDVVWWKLSQYDKDCLNGGRGLD